MEIVIIKIKIVGLRPGEKMFEETLNINESTSKTHHPKILIGKVSSVNLLEINNVDIHVECYGDSPLIDPQLIDESIGIYFKYKDQADYFSSSIKTTYPPGLEFSIYNGSILIDVNKRISADDPLREHVGFNITRFEDYKIFSIEAPLSLQKPELYLEVDTKEDFLAIKKIMEYKS